MPAPTVVDFQSSNFADTSSGSEVTPSVAWQTGDRLIVFGITEGQPQTISVPTATGLTFAAVSWAEINILSACHMYAWTATAGSNGSGAITATVDGGGALVRGIAAFVYRGSAGLGNLSRSTGNETVSVRSLTRGGNNSAMAFALGDWNATADSTVTPTPSGTLRVAVATPNATMFVCDYGDQGASGTADVGITGFSGVVANVMIALEVLGSPTTVDQYGYRGRNDDGSETTATWKAAQNTAFTITPDQTFRLRLGVNTVGDLTSTQFKLQYRKVGATSWRDVDKTG